MPATAALVKKIVAIMGHELFESVITIESKSMIPVRQAIEGSILALVFSPNLMLIMKETAIPIMSALDETMAYL